MKADVRASALQAAGLFGAAETVAAVNLADAERAGSVEDVVAAHTRRSSIALDCDRPRAALRWGMLALPAALGSHPVDPDLRVRLYVNLAKATWLLGLERDFLAYADAAVATADHESVSAPVRVHHHTVQGLVAHLQSDLSGARAHMHVALDLAVKVGLTHMEIRCHLNLINLALESGALDEAETWVRAALDACGPGPERVEALGDGVNTALALGDLQLAGLRLRGLLDAYLDAPSLLSPQALGYLYEAIGSYYAHRGFSGAASALWALAAGWFAKRGRDRDVTRARERVAARRHGPGVAEPAVDPDLRYLGGLFAGAWQGEAQDADFQVAVAVNRVLPAIAPAAATAATEHAAMLRPAGPVAPLLAARSEAGRAAVRVLTGEDEPARAALDVLAAYQRLCSAGLSWPAVIRSMHSARLAHDSVRALDHLFQRLIA